MAKAGAARGGAATAAAGGAADRRAAFEELLRPHQGALWGFALRLTRNAADAEDLLQEGLYRAYRGLDGFEPGTHFKRWVFRIVTNAFLSRCRTQARAPRAVGLEGLGAPAPAPEDLSPAAALEDELASAATDWQALYAEAVDDEVKRALDDLPDELRATLLLSGLGGLRYQEIADVLEVPVGTVMSRLFRARQRLKRALHDYALARGLGDQARAVGRRGEG